MKFPRKNQIPLILIIVGLTVIFWARHEVNRRVQPDNFTIRNTDFEVVWIGGKGTAEQVDFIMKEKNEVIHSIYCPTHSWANREFYMVIFDINKDGADDIYYDGCVGKGFLAYNPEVMEMKEHDLDETPPLKKLGAYSFWFRDLKVEAEGGGFMFVSPTKNLIFFGPGSTITTLGAICVAIGLISYFVIAVKSLILFTKS